MYHTESSSVAGTTGSVLYSKLEPRPSLDCVRNTLPVYLLGAFRLSVDMLVIDAASRLIFDLASNVSRVERVEIRACPYPDGLDLGEPYLPTTNETLASIFHKA